MAGRPSSRFLLQALVCQDCPVTSAEPVAARIGCSIPAREPLRATPRLQGRVPRCFLALNRASQAVLARRLIQG